MFLIERLLLLLLLLLLLQLLLLQHGLKGHTEPFIRVREEQDTEYADVVVGNLSNDYLAIQQ
jgi:hypothetical protein